MKLTDYLDDIQSQPTAPDDYNRGIQHEAQVIRQMIKDGILTGCEDI